MGQDEYKQSEVKPIAQVKVFFSSIKEHLENDINDFLTNKKIGSSELIDIKYQFNGTHFTAMVVYKKNISYEK